MKRMPTFDALIGNPSGSDGSESRRHALRLASANCFNTTCATCLRKTAWRGGPVRAHAARVAMGVLESGRKVGARRSSAECMPCGRIDVRSGTSPTSIPEVRVYDAPHACDTTRTLALRFRQSTLSPLDVPPAGSIARTHAASANPAAFQARL